jgi:hypothetical protein
LEEIAALRPLALGHDQEASACPWAQLTRQTAEYPSRRAQLAIALLQGALPATPDVVSRLYRCDDCGLCRAWSRLPQPPDLGRALWSVRALLVAQGAVPEVESLRARLNQHGHIYGDLAAAWARLGPGDPGAGTLFVPDGALLAHDLEAAVAALQTARRAAGPVALLTPVPDSGQALRELGLAPEAERTQAAARQRIVEAGYRLVLAGTPKEAVALAGLLARLPVRVMYAGSALAQAVLDGRVTLPAGTRDGKRIVLHPSFALLHGLADHELVEQFLSTWLGHRYCREPDVKRSAWPAAVERPAISLDPALARRLAQRRLDSLLALEPDIVLTCDPFSKQALSAVAPARVAVQDLLAFAMA